MDTLRAENQLLLQIFQFFHRLHPTKKKQFGGLSKPAPVLYNAKSVINKKLIPPTKSFLVGGQVCQELPGSLYVSALGFVGSV